MAFDRLPESVQTLYAELLDQLRAADAEAAVLGLKGTFVSKTIRGRTYWYLQRSEGESKKQIYLGAETPALLRKIELSKANAEGNGLDEARRRDLVAMVAAGGMARESAAISTVMRVLSDAGVFRFGGVLVGTQAFTCLANLLGVVFEQQTMRTADIDVAQDDSIALGLPAAGDGALLQRLRAEEPRFVAVPGFDAGDASTSFRVRGRDLRVDFLIPAGRGKASRRPVFLPHLGMSAQPLEGLGYLIEDHIDAAFLGGSGVRVNVPQPARFALHKLWVASERPASETAKQRKDLRQAEGLLSVLLADRPGDLTEAWHALRPGMRGAIRGSLVAVDAEVNRRVREAVAASKKQSP